MVYCPRARTCRLPGQPPNQRQTRLGGTKKTVHVYEELTKGLLRGTRHKIESGLCQMVPLPQRRQMCRMSSMTRPGKMQHGDLCCRRQASFHWRRLATPATDDTLTFITLRYTAAARGNIFHPSGGSLLQTIIRHPGSMSEWHPRQIIVHAALVTASRAAFLFRR